MKASRIILMLVILSTSLFSGCGKEEYFKSEKGIEKELQGTWSLIPIPRYDANGNVIVESWTFNGGKLTTVKGGTTYTADYKIETSMLKVKIKVENFPSVAGVYNYNTTWNLVRLDKDFLVICNNQNNSSGLMQYEFQKQ